MKYKNILYYCVSFFTGATTLVIELVAFRLLAPYFGTSSYVTGITINIVLLALATGYYIGGYAGDKLNNEKLPFFLLLFVSLYLFIFYFFYGKTLQIVSDFNVVTGTIVSIFSMFFIPITILAFIPTYFIRILTTKKSIGTAAGKIYSVSTLGSIIGGIATTFILIPYLGSRATFLCGIIFVFILGLVGLGFFSFYFLFIALFIPAFFIVKPDADAAFIYSKESEYNIIKVGKENNDMFVYLNKYDAFFSKSLNDKMLSDNYYDYFLLGPMINDAKDILILGNGAGTSMTGFSHFFDVSIVGIEIDKELTVIGKKFFKLQENENIKILHEDARVYINKTKKKYDIIIVDLYNGGAYIPFHLATVEFFKRINEALTENGIMIVNIPFYALNNKLEKYYINTIYKSFKDNYLIDHVLFSFKSGMSKEKITEKLMRFENNVILNGIIDEVKSSFTKYTNEAAYAFFTDEKSMIEKLTYSAIKR